MGPWVDCVVRSGCVGCALTAVGSMLGYLPGEGRWVTLASVSVLMYTLIPLCWNVNPNRECTCRGSTGAGKLFSQW